MNRAFTLSAAAAAAAAALALGATPAAAADIPGTGLEINVEAEAMSDYRFRGVSRSGEDPAVQASVTVSHDSGFYVGTRATTLDGIDGFRANDPDFDDLGDIEFDVYAGYGMELGGGLSADAGVMYYHFTGAEGPTDYVEPYASVSYLLGPVEATAGAKYAPAQAGTGDEDMLYVFAEAEAGIPFTGVKLRAHAGRQDWGAYGSYWNWSVGGGYTLGPVELGLRYVDTDLPAVRGQDAGFVASIGVGF